MHIIIKTYAPLDSKAFGPYSIEDAKAKKASLAKESGLPLHYYSILLLEKE